MTAPDSHRLPRHPELPVLLKRIAVSPGSVRLRLAAMGGSSEIEAFLIAMFDVTANAHSFREQDDLIRSVIACTGQTEACCRAGCGVEIVLTPQGCEIRHHDDQDVSAMTIATAMLQALDELDDPAGMMLAGLASAWDCPSVRIAVPRSVMPPIY